MSIGTSPYTLRTAKNAPAKTAAAAISSGHERSYFGTGRFVFAAPLSSDGFPNP